MTKFEGKFAVKEVKIAIVVARFNDFITSKLLEGALDALRRHEVTEDAIDIAWVPGAFEIPLIAAKLAKTKHSDETEKFIKFIQKKSSLKQFENYGFTVNK